MRRASSTTSQWGVHHVNGWDDDAVVLDAAGVEAQKALQPAVKERDEYDREIDQGKLKHKPRKDKQHTDVKAAFDSLQRKKAAQANGAQQGKGKHSTFQNNGKGKGKDKGKGKGKVKGKGKDKGKGKGKVKGK